MRWRTVDRGKTLRVRRGAQIMVAPSTPDDGANWTMENGGDMPYDLLLYEPVPAQSAPAEKLSRRRP